MTEKQQKKKLKNCLKREVYKKGMDDKRFEVTKTISNISHNDYDVNDYKMCRKEADIVLEALRYYQRGLEPVSEGSHAETTV